MGDFKERTPEQIAEELSAVLKPHGYTLSAEKIEKKANWGEFKIAIPITILFVVFYIFKNCTNRKMGDVDIWVVCQFGFVRHFSRV